jgi:nucleoside-diphosphate-sugar epimerase
MAADLMSRDMTVRCDRARAELQWAPVVSRAEGLAELSGAPPTRAARIPA